MSMDLIHGAFNYYAIFCVTTLICIMQLQYKAFRETGLKFNFKGSVIYYSVTIVMTLLLAPMFFVVFIFRSGHYYGALIDYIEENYT